MGFKAAPAPFMEPCTVAWAAFTSEGNFFLNAIREQSCALEVSTALEIDVPCNRKGNQTFSEHAHKTENLVDLQPILCRIDHNITENLQNTSGM